MHSGNNILPDDSDEALEAGSYESNVKQGKTGQIEESGPIAKKSLWRNWPLMSSIIVYCVFSLHDMAYTEVSLIPSFFNQKKKTTFIYILLDIGSPLPCLGCYSCMINIQHYRSPENLFWMRCSILDVAVLLLPYTPY